MSDIQRAYLVDGKPFATKAEAETYKRRPMILAALNLITEDNEELSVFLIDNVESLVSAFESGTMRRVTVSDRKKMAKALEAVAKIHEASPDTNKALAFLVANTEDFIKGFKWPGQKRLTSEEKEAKASEEIALLADNEEMAAWCLENRERLLEAFAAGKPKKVMNAATMNGLAAYQAKKKKEKEDALAAKEEDETSEDEAETSEDEAETSEDEAEYEEAEANEAESDPSDH